MRRARLIEPRDRALIKATVLRRAESKPQSK